MRLEFEPQAAKKLTKTILVAFVAKKISSLVLIRPARLHSPGSIKQFQNYFEIV
jgi:hypothetical protein